MRTRIAPLMRVLFIIAALMLGQVQTALAVSMGGDAANVALDDAAPLHDSASDPAEVLRDGEDWECKVYISAYLLTAPFDGIDPGDTKANNYNATFVETADTNPAAPNPSPAVYRDTGETTTWLIVAENNTNASDCPPEGEEALTDINISVTFSGTGGGSYPPIDVPLIWVNDPLNPGTLAHHGDIAWGTFDWVIPPDVNGNLNIVTSFVSEAVNNRDTLGWDVIDGDTDEIGINGPGFKVVSFAPDPPVAEAALGDLLTYKLVIQNTRPNSIIQWLNVTSTDYPSIAARIEASCNPLSAWVLSDGSTPLNPAETAECTIANVPVEGDPPPQNFVIKATIEASEAADGNDTDNYTLTATSTSVPVKLPAIGITKEVASIRRGAETIYSAGGTMPLVLPGDRIDYTIKVTNTGQIQLRNIFVIDSLTGPLYVEPSRILEPGEQLTFTTTHIVQVGGQDPLQNTARVTADATGFSVSVDAQAVVSVDVADSTMIAELRALAPGTGTPWVGGIEVNETVQYALTVRNVGAVQINNPQIMPLALPLRTLGVPPAFSPPNIPAGGERTIYWMYQVTADDALNYDPLVNTVRVRGQLPDGSLLYAQTQASLDVTNPALEISAQVLDPAGTDTVLRGQPVQYEVSVWNKGGDPICNVTVNQIRRDPYTGLETPVAVGLPFAWNGAPGQIAGDDTKSTVATYLVTGADVDPLDMIFEVTAEDCGTGADLTDRTARILGISNVQLNTSLSLSVPSPTVGMAVEFTYQVVNVSATTLEDVSATWCLYRSGTEVPDHCNRLFDDGVLPNLPSSLGAFEDAADVFPYTIDVADATANPFLAEVTLTGKDNKGNSVAIKTARVVEVITPNLALNLTGVQTAVLGDTIPFDFTIVNDTETVLSDVRVYNLLKEDAGTITGYEEVGYFPTILDEVGQNTAQGTFDYTLDTLAGITDNKLTMRVRLHGKSGEDDVVATATYVVEIVPMVGVTKTGDSSRPVGMSVHYTVVIRNNSRSQMLTINSYDDAVLADYGVPVSHNDFAPWPALGEGLDPEPGRLPPGGLVTGSFRIPGPPEDPGADGVRATPSPLVNTFIVHGSRPDGTPVAGLGSHVVEIACPLDINFQVTNIDNDPDDVLGETLRWRISFTNISPNTVEGAIVTESLEWNGVVPDADGNRKILWPGDPGVLPPGSTAWIIGQNVSEPYFDRLITSDYYTNAEQDTMKDTVRIDFSEVGGASSCEESREYNIYSPIRLVKIPSTPIAFTGEVVDYEIIVENVTEADDAPYHEYYVTVYDSLLHSGPVPLHYNGDTQPPATSGILGPGERVETVLSREVLASDPETLVNVLTAEFPDPTNPAMTLITSTEAEVYTGNPLKLTKTPSVGKASAGAWISYDYTVTNVSPYFVEVTSLVDDRIGNIIPQMSQGTIPLEPGEVFTWLDEPYQLPLDAVGSVKNTVIVEGLVSLPSGARPIRNEVSATVNLTATEIDLTKTVHHDVDGAPGDEIDDIFGVPDGVPDVESGTPVHYCFRVENTNPGTLTFVEDIVIQDVLFPGLLDTFKDAVMDQLGHLQEESQVLYGGEVVTFCEGPLVLTVSSELGDPLTNVVSLSGTTNEGTPIFAEDSVTVDIRGTDLLVTKRPSQTVAFVGDSVTYTITLFNNNETYDIIVDEVIDQFISGAPSPISLDQFDWSASKIDASPVGRLGANGGQATFTYSYTVQLDDPDPLENTVRSSGWLDDAVDPAERTPVADNTRAVMAVTESQLVVRKTAAPNLANASPNTCVDAGGPSCNTVRYTVSITNVGSVPVQNVMAVDEHFDVLTGAYVQQVFEGDDLSDTNLAPFETAFIYHDLPMPTSTQINADFSLDPFLNKITAYGVILDADDKPVPLPEELQDPDDPYDDDKSVKATASDAVDIVQPNIRALKSPVTLASTPGSNALYTIQITNTGDTALDNITFQDLVGSNPVVDLDAMCAEGSGQVCDWVYGALPYKDHDGDGTPEYNPLEGQPYDPDEHKLQPQEQLIGTVDVLIPDDWKDSEFTNVIEVTGRTPDSTPVRDRSSATIDIRNDGIRVEKLSSVSAVPVGTPVTYTVRVTNVGTSAIRRLVIADPGMDGVPGHSMTIESGFPDNPGTPDDDSDTLDPDEEYLYQYQHVIMPTDGDLYINRATVTATTVNENVVLNIAQSAVEVQAASVGIEKLVCVGEDADGWPPPDPCLTTVNIGDDVTPDRVTYYLHIFNPGAVPVTNVTVTDSFGTVPGVPATLAPDDGVPNDGDDEVWVSYPYDVVPGDPDPLVNLALVSGETDGGAVVQDTAMARLSLVTSDLILEKSGPAQATVGEMVTYTLTITHGGGSDAPIESIQVIDPLSDVYGAASITECEVASLASGASHPCEFTHTVTQADVSPLVNTATATGMQGGVLVSDAATHTLEIVTPGLSVSKFADKLYTGIGEDVTFTYRIENTGSAVINNLVVTESDGSAVFDPTWPTFLIPGQVAIRTWARTMAPTDSDPYVNTLTVTGTVGGTPIMASATETVYLANGSLIVSNTPSVTFVQDGHDVTFTYTVMNLGPDPLQNLSISDNLCDDAVLNAALPDTLAAGVSASVYCTATAALPGPLVSSVYVSGEEVPDGDVVIPVSDTATAEVAVTSGELLVVKTADRALVSTVAPDNVITYTIKVTNVGDETLTWFEVDDPLVVGLAPAPPTMLGKGQSFTMTGTYTVPDPAPASVVNNVTVTATGVSSGDEYTDSDSVSVAVLEPGATGELILTKQASRLNGRPGDSVTYTFRVQNITTEAFVSGAELHDPMLAYANPPIADGIVSLPDLGPGNAWTRSYTVQIPADWVEPTFVNTAQVTSDGGETLHDTASVTVDVEILVLTKSATGPVLLGDTIEYTFDITNYSIVNVPNVTLDDPLIESWDMDLTGGSVPVGGLTITGQFTVPEAYTEATVDNTATLYIGDVAVATDSVSLDVISAGLAIDILEIVQDSGGVMLDRPQTGEPVEVHVAITNFGLVDITDPDYTVIFDITDGECTPTEALPGTLAAGETVETWCEYTPPKGADDYFIDPFLMRTVTATATGTVDTDEIASDPVETTVEMIDLLLVVDLVLDPVTGGLPGDAIDVTLTISNMGASPIGCDATVDAAEPCHLSFSDGDDSDLLELLFETELTGFENVVLAPKDTLGDVFPLTKPYTIEELDVTQPLEVVVSGGYYDADLLGDGLLEHYTTYDNAEAELIVQRPEIELSLLVIPNPTIFGQTVNYSLTITNTGGVTVTGLYATYKISPFAAPATSSGIMLVSGDASPWAQALEGTFALPTTTLEPGQQVTGLLAKIEDQEGPYQFLVTVTGNGMVGEQFVGQATGSVWADIWPTGTAELDPNAVDPVIEKTPNVTATQPGGVVTWTITLRNNWTQAMSNVILQDSVPSTMAITGVTSDRGTASVQDGYVVLNVGLLNPGEIVTVTINTTVNAEVTSPSIITNTACAQRTGSGQVCESATVSVGPSVGGLPATGIAMPPQETARGSAVGPLSIGLLAGLLVLMAAGVSRRRAQLAALFVGVAVVIVAVVIVLAVSRGDDDSAPPTEPPDDEITMQVPPETTPYVPPTPVGVRSLIIPKLGDQFRVPVPIVDLPITGREWDVSGLGYYVGWLEGTTWMAPDWGNTVLAAHVQLGTRNPGPFWGLTELVPGDEIIVVEGDLRRRFAVESITKVDPSDWTVTAPTQSPTLTLITCTEWDNNYGVFAQRLVVRAVPADGPAQG